MLAARFASALVLATTVGALGACGKASPPPPVDDTRTTSAPYPAAPEKKPGISNGQKVVVLAAAAAAYYLYKHHQGTAATGPDGQYYLSKNGRVYYRDAEHRAHWVTPPPEGIRVPESEASDYRQFQGYDGSTTGRDLAGLGNDD